MSLLITNLTRGIHNQSAIASNRSPLGQSDGASRLDVFTLSIIALVRPFPFLVSPFGSLFGRYKYLTLLIGQYLLYP